MILKHDSINSENTKTRQLYNLIFMPFKYENHYKKERKFLFIFKRKQKYARHLILDIKTTFLFFEVDSPFRSISNSTKNQMHRS